ARVKRLLNDHAVASDLDRQFGDLPVGLRKILLSMIHGFASNPRGRAALPSLPRPGMRSSVAHLVACQDVIGSSVTDILMCKCYRYLILVGKERMSLKAELVKQISATGFTEAIDLMACLAVLREGKSLVMPRALEAANAALAATIVQKALLQRV